MKRHHKYPLTLGALALMLFTAVKTVDAVRFNRFYNAVVNYTAAAESATPKELSILEQKLLERKESFPEMYCTPDADCTLTYQSRERLHRTVLNFEDHGVAYGEYIKSDGTTTFLVGDIEKSWKETFNDPGFEPFDYKIILYRPSGDLKGPENMLAHWAYNRAYLNLTAAENQAESIYNFGQSHPDGKKSDMEPLEKFKAELYGAIEEQAKEDHPVLYRLSSKKAFKKSFVKMIIDSGLKSHEPVHNTSKNSELEPCTNQIAMSPKTNSYVFIFLLENSSDPDYGSVIGHLEGQGYSMDRLADMSPEERSEIAKSGLH